MSLSTSLEQEVIALRSELEYLRQLVSEHQVRCCYPKFKKCPTHGAMRLPEEKTEEPLPSIPSIPSINPSPPSASLPTIQEEEYTDDEELEMALVEVEEEEYTDDEELEMALVEVVEEEEEEKDQKSYTPSYTPPREQPRMPEVLPEVATVVTTPERVPVMTTVDVATEPVVASVITTLPDQVPVMATVLSPVAAAAVSNPKKQRRQTVVDEKEVAGVDLRSITLDELTSKNIGWLKMLCKMHNLKGYSKHTKKDDLVTFIVENRHTTSSK